MRLMLALEILKPNKKGNIEEKKQIILLLVLYIFCVLYLWHILCLKTMGNYNRV